MAKELDERYKKIIVIGAGLAGSLLAIFLAKRGYEVHVYEKREDTRKNPGSWEGRSINLALSTRGITALQKAGVADLILPTCIEMTGRLMHSLQGTTSYMPYGLPGQANRSAGRQRLNETLMDEAEKFPNVHLYFHHSCRSINLQEKEIVFDYEFEEGKKERRVVKGDLIIGADGAFSEVRNAILRKRGTDYSQEYLSHSYKELCIPAKDGEYALEKNVLHIWPRGDFMMIALPNPDKSFTVTLFLPNEKFDKLTTEEEVVKFFQETFPDAVPIMPTYLKDFFKNPTGSLITIKVSPWHFGDSAVILGDAAHAIVPFYGQGMNASLEDVTFLDSLIEKHNGNFEIILREFSKLRKPNADAIAELSQRNYIEMRSKVASRLFLWRTALEKKIYKYFPNRWMPLYSMVTFSNIPYSEVIQRADRQNKILDRVFNLFFRGGAVASIGLLCYLGYQNRDRISKL